MAKNLVIVESPAKVKTIKKFLGTNYEVCASQGHVRDLPKSTLGVDVEHNFEPKYITIRGKGEVLAKLRKEVKKADNLDFKWLDLDEKDERTITQVLDDMQAESDGIAEAVAKLKELLGGVDL